MPDEVPEGGIDLREFYLETYRYFWTLVGLLTLAIMIFLIPARPDSDYLGGFVRHEALDGFVLLVTVAALATRRIRVQQAAVVIVVGMTSWIYLASSRVFH